MVSAIDAHSFNASFDQIDLADNSFALSENQAQSLSDAGLSFAVNDTGVELQAAGTHLKTSLSDLQKLGVDHITTVEHKADLNLGQKLAGTSIPKFDVSATVTAHIDSAPGKVVTLGDVLHASDSMADPLALMSGAGLATALQAAGIDHLFVDATAHLEINDADLKPLLTNGFTQAAAGAEIDVVVNNNSMNLSLADLADLGVDHVITKSTTPTSLSLDAGITGNDIQAALNAILEEFAQKGNNASQAIFEDADNVTLKVSSSANFEIDADTFNKLQVLGVDDIEDEHGVPIPHKS